MVYVSTSLHLTRRPYQLLSEAVAMGNSKAKEKIGYFHLVRIYVKSLLVTMVTSSLGPMLHKTSRRLRRYLQNLQLRGSQLGRW